MTGAKKHRGEWAPNPGTDRTGSEFSAKSAGNPCQSCQSPGMLYWGKKKRKEGIPQQHPPPPPPPPPQRRARVHRQSAPPAPPPRPPLGSPLRPDGQFIEELLSGEVVTRSEEHTSELQSRQYLVCRL